MERPKQEDIIEWAQMPQTRWALQKAKEQQDELKEEGAKVDQITQALAQLGTDLDSLIAKPGGITPAQTQTILDGITALDAKVKAALTPA